MPQESNITSCSCDETKQKEQYYLSILHAHIVAMTKTVNPRIKVRLTDNGHGLDIYGIEEQDLPKLSFPVNSPNAPQKLTLAKGNVYIGNNSSEYEIVFGLKEYLMDKFTQSDYEGFKNGDTIHTPFDVTPSIPVTTDNLSNITTGDASKSLVNKVKNYYLHFRNESWGCFWGSVVGLPCY